MNLPVLIRLRVLVQVCYISTECYILVLGDLRHLNNVIQITLINGGWHMVPRLEPMDIVGSKRLLQSLKNLPAKLSRLVPLRMKYHLKFDTRSAFVLDTSLCLEPHFLNMKARWTHLEDLFQPAMSWDEEGY